MGATQVEGDAAALSTSATSAERACGHMSAATEARPVIHFNARRRCAESASDPFFGGGGSTSRSRIARTRQARASQAELGLRPSLEGQIARTASVIARGGDTRQTNWEPDTSKDREQSS
jgi:hypothetical protein